MCAGKQALEFFSYLGGMELEVMQATRSIAECIVDTTTKVLLKRVLKKSAPAVPKPGLEPSESAFLHLRSSHVTDYCRSAFGLVSWHPQQAILHLGHHHQGMVWDLSIVDSHQRGSQ